MRHDTLSVLAEAVSQFTRDLQTGPLTPSDATNARAILQFASVALDAAITLTIEETTHA